MKSLACEEVIREGRGRRRWEQAVDRVLAALLEAVAQTRRGLLGGSTGAEDEEDLMKKLLLEHREQVLSVFDSELRQEEAARKLQEDTESRMAFLEKQWKSRYEDLRRSRDELLRELLRLQEQRYQQQQAFDGVWTALEGPSTTAAPQGVSVTTALRILSKLRVPSHPVSLESLPSSPPPEEPAASPPAAASKPSNVKEAIVTTRREMERQMKQKLYFTEEAHRKEVEVLEGTNEELREEVQLREVEIKRGMAQRYAAHLEEVQKTAKQKQELIRSLLERSSHREEAAKMAHHDMVTQLSVSFEAVRQELRARAFAEAEAELSEKQATISTLQDQNSQLLLQLEEERATAAPEAVQSKKAKPRRPRRLSHQDLQKPLPPPPPPPTPQPHTKRPRIAVTPSPSRQQLLPTSSPSPSPVKSPRKAGAAAAAVRILTAFAAGPAESLSGPLDKATQTAAVGEQVHKKKEEVRLEQVARGLRMKVRELQKTMAEAKQGTRSLERVQQERQLPQPSLQSLREQVTRLQERNQFLEEKVCLLQADRRDENPAKPPGVLFQQPLQPPPSCLRVAATPDRLHQKLSAALLRVERLEGQLRDLQENSDNASDNTAAAAVPRGSPLRSLVACYAELLEVAATSRDNRCIPDPLEYHRKVVQCSRTVPEALQGYAKLVEAAESLGVAPFEVQRHRMLLSAWSPARKFKGAPATAAVRALAAATEGGWRVTISRDIPSFTISPHTGHPCSGTELEFVSFFNLLKLKALQLKGAEGDVPPAIPVFCEAREAGGGGARRPVHPSPSPSLSLSPSPPPVLRVPLPHPPPESTDKPVTRTVGVQAEVEKEEDACADVAAVRVVSFDLSRETRASEAAAASSRRKFRISRRLSDATPPVATPSPPPAPPSAMALGAGLPCPSPTAPVPARRSPSRPRARVHWTKYRLASSPSPVQVPMQRPATACGLPQGDFSYPVAAHLFPPPRPGSTPVH